MIAWFCLVAALAADGPPAGWTELTPSGPPATPTATQTAAPAAESTAEPAAPAEVAPALPATQDEEDADDVVLVIGEHIIAERRAAIVRKMESLGWRSRLARDGVIHFHGAEAWMGKAKLYPSGDLEFIFVPVTVSTPKGYEANYQTFGMEHGNPPVQPSIGANFGSPSPKKVDAAQQEVRAQVDPLVKEYRAAIQGRALSAELEELPDRLHRLWFDGVGLDLVPLKTNAERRQAILDFWATRTDTPEGRAVMRQVEAFVHSVVQDLDPVTDEERTAAESRRTDGRTLGL